MQPPLDTQSALDLLEALAANPTFTTGEPSAEFRAFLDRIEKADPAAFQDDPDNTGPSWGHSQFSAGSLTCTRVICSWSSVGSPFYACKLIAAVLTTCHVARWLCRDTNPQPSFISDNYLATIIDILWACWKAVDGASSTISCPTHYLLTTLSK